MLNLYDVIRFLKGKPNVKGLHFLTGFFIWCLFFSNRSFRLKYRAGKSQIPKWNACRIAFLVIWGLFCPQKIALKARCPTCTNHMLKVYSEGRSSIYHSTWWHSLLIPLTKRFGILFGPWRFILTFPSWNLLYCSRQSISNGYHKSADAAKPSYTWRWRMVQPCKYFFLMLPNLSKRAKTQQWTLQRCSIRMLLSFWCIGRGNHSRCCHLTRQSVGCRLLNRPYRQVLIQRQVSEHSQDLWHLWPKDVAKFWAFSCRTRFKCTGWGLVWTWRGRLKMQREGSSWKK